MSWGFWAEIGIPNNRLNYLKRDKMSYFFRNIKISDELAPQAAPETWECAFSQLPTQGSVLVAGAGRGGVSVLLEKSGFKVTSLDLHPEHFVAPGMECKKADFNHPLAIESAAFDTVICIEVLEHLENPWGFLREAMRILRPNGRLIFTSPNVINIPSRLLFLKKGLFPYFREQSFRGCYHVTPIFPWAVMRWAQTTEARVDSITYSRANWPTSDDVPRHWERRWSKKLKDMLPVNSLTGEISCYSISKSGVPTVAVGAHYA